jgi:hypothetical protein
VRILLIVIVCVLVGCTSGGGRSTIRNETGANVSVVRIDADGTEEPVAGLQSGDYVTVTNQRWCELGVRLVAKSESGIVVEVRAGRLCPGDTWIVTGREGPSDPSAAP